MCADTAITTKTGPPTCMAEGPLSFLVMLVSAHLDALTAFLAKHRTMLRKVTKIGECTPKGAGPLLSGVAGVDQLA